VGLASPPVARTGSRIDNPQMFDLSPEKIMALLAVGLVVLGPHRLPTAARSLAQGLTKARRIAATLTDPVQASLAEPRQHLEAAVAEVRGAIQGPIHDLGAHSSGAPVAQPPPAETATFLPRDGIPGTTGGFDPANN
jgi:Sec-independent protein translocase protein TatA